MADLVPALEGTTSVHDTGPDRAVITAEDFARATAANLHGNFGRVVRTADLLG